MRGLAILALLASMGLATLFVLGPPAVPERDSPAELAEELRSRLATGEADGDRMPAAQPSRRGDQPPDARASKSTPTFYKYADDQGRIHFVQSAGDIPSRYRKNAGSVELANQIIRLEPEAVAPVLPARLPSRQPAAQQIEQRRRQARADVVVYTTSWCGWCRKTVAWLDEAGVDYENRDIESNPRYRAELLAKTGTTSIPMVEIDGQIVRGFSPGRMERLLDL